MCFGGGGSRTPEPRQEVREETKAAQKEEEEQKIINRQKALDEEVETSAPVKTSLFYDTGGTVFRRKVGRGSLFTGSQGGSGFLSQGVQTTQTGLRRY
tara:strand:- start:230 stop:523 length:294 start_codon:yes stop_codon:yes gene_type:complete